MNCVKISHLQLNKTQQARFFLADVRNIYIFTRKITFLRFKNNNDNPHCDVSLSSELSKKFWKSFRLNVCQCGKRSTAKSRRYCTRRGFKSTYLVFCVCIKLIRCCRLCLSVMSGSSAPWEKALGSGRCATAPAELSATFSCSSAYEPLRRRM